MRSREIFSLSGLETAVLHKSSRRKSLVRNATAHVTQEEEQRIHFSAEQAGVTKSEWCRQAILSCLEMPASTRVILAELMSLRKILLALKLEEIHSQTITEDRLRLVVEQAEVSKFAMADKRVLEFRKQESHD